MLQDRIAKRYAKSLYDLGTERGETQILLNDCKEVHNLVKQSTQFVAFLNSPVIISEKKEAILSKLLEGKVSASFLGLVTLLAKKERAHLVDNIVMEFINLYNHKSNITEVELLTATETTVEFQNTVKAKVERELKTTVQMSTKVDDRLVGGFVLRIGDKIYDGSLQTGLMNLRKQLTETR